VKIEFITRDVCPLCDEAREMLARVTRRFALDIVEVDVDGDEQLLASYGTTVPVARSDSGTVLAAGRWTESSLIAALARYRLTGS